MYVIYNCFEKGVEYSVYCKNSKSNHANSLNKFYRKVVLFDSKPALQSVCVT